MSTKMVSFDNLGPWPPIEPLATQGASGGGPPMSGKQKISLKSLPLLSTWAPSPPGGPLVVGLLWSKTQCLLVVLSEIKKMVKNLSLQSPPLLSTDLSKF